MKWLLYLVLVALVGGAWWVFSNKGKEIESIKSEITRLEEVDAYDEKLPDLKSELQASEGGRTFSGILLTFLSAGLVGIVFVVHILPMFAQRVTHAVYDSAEMIERDVMHDARALVAQGEYHSAIEAFKEAAKADPMNRLPWVEIAKIYKDNLDDPHSAIETIRYALESQEWEINDAAYFLFRLAELYDEILGDRATAAAILQQVVEQFPRTRHSANANTRLHEWGLDQQQAAEQVQVSPAVQPPPPESIRYELPAGDDNEPGRSA